MADDTAHVPAGPELHQPDVDVAASTMSEHVTPDAHAPDMAAEHGGDDGEAFATDTAIQHLSAGTKVIAAEVELVGRTNAPVARLGEAEPLPVLVGAASAARADDAPSTGITGPPPPAMSSDGVPGSTAGSDLPVWSFRDAPGRPELAPPTAADRNQAELPFTPATAVPAPQPWSQPMFGPVGRPRSAVLMPVFAAVTLGVYALVWHHRVNRELEEFDPKLHVRRVRSTVAMAVPWLMGLLATLAGAAFIIGGRVSIHIPLASHVTTAQAYYLLAGLAAVPYLTLLVPFSVVAVVMTLERLRCVEEHVGTTTDRQVRPVGSSLLLAIPVAGGLVLLGREQRRLNAVWDVMAAAGRNHR
jgi:hypothetical protein